MKQFISILAALGLGISTTTTMIACSNNKSATIVNKPLLWTLFSNKQIVVGIDEPNDSIINKILSVNKIERTVFDRNATFNFLNHRIVRISVLETSDEWGGADVEINLLDNLNTASFSSIIYPDQVTFDLSQRTIAFIKSKITSELDWTALRINLDYERSVFRITPNASANKYWGLIEIGYSKTPRRTLQSLIKITNLTVLKNATKTDILNQLSALNDGFLFDENQLEISDYNYRTDFTLTITPKADSDLYYGASLTINVCKNINDLDLNGFAINVDNDSTKTIDQFKTSHANLKIDWDAMDIQTTTNTLTVSASATSQKYIGSFTSILWQPILFLDNYQADNNESRILGDLLKVNESPEIHNLNIGIEVDKSSDQLKVYNKDHPEQNQIIINYYERIDLGTTITTTKLTRISNGANDTEIKLAIIAQNNLTPKQANAILNQVDVYKIPEQNSFYLIIKNYGNISTVFFGKTNNIAFDV